MVIPFYPAEHDIRHLVTKGRVVHAALAQPINVPQSAQGAVSDPDLFRFSSVMVTAGVWNLNDDVFDVGECWRARRTPVYKRLDVDHDTSANIGSIIAAKVIDANGVQVADDIDPKALPAKFDIVADAIIYKSWDSQACADRCNAILADIASKKMKVSMECLFDGFDYALVDAAGNQTVVIRNEATASLSKHLKAYNGDGKYGSYRIGRILKNICFSGLGLTKTPANLSSVIISTGPFNAATAATSLSESIARFFGVTAALPVLAPAGSSLATDVSNCIS